MYERQGREGRSNGGGWQAGQQLGEEAQRIGEHISRERAHSEAIAQQLGRESLMQWSKAVTGLLALPTAVALGAASWALYLAAFVERGFEIFQREAMEMRGRAEQRLGEEGRRWEREEPRGERRHLGVGPEQRPWERAPETRPEGTPTA